MTGAAQRGFTAEDAEGWLPEADSQLRSESQARHSAEEDSPQRTRRAETKSGKEPAGSRRYEEQEKDVGAPAPSLQRSVHRGGIRFTAEDTEGTENEEKNRPDPFGFAQGRGRRSERD